MPKPKPKTFRPVRPNAGIEAEYRRRLLKIIDEMAASVLYWVRAAYNQNEPVLAAMDDVSPSIDIAKIVRRLTRRWQKKINDLAPKLARYFAQAVAERSDAALRKMLRDAGMTVKFQQTPAMRDVMGATVRQNVALIKSIPQQSLGKVEAAVMRSVQEGRDLATLTKTLQQEFAVTRRRAKLIALDQNSKATSALQRVRQIELGLETAVWVHSGGGNKPRPCHVEMSGKTYDVAKGMWDKHEQLWVHPGQLIWCRCVSRVVIPGLT